MRKALTLIIIFVVVVLFQLHCNIRETYAETGWSDDFESYPLNNFPSANWSSSGNSNAYVDNTRSVSGTQSLRIYGTVGGCWGGVAHRGVIQPPFFIKFFVYPGTEDLSTLNGCHPNPCDVVLYTGPSWTYPLRFLISFDNKNQIWDSWDKTKYIGTYFPLNWYKIKIKYEIVDESTVRLSYWINDIFKGDCEVASTSYENDLAYLGIVANEGPTWYDDVKVVPDDDPTGEPRIYYRDSDQDGYGDPRQSIPAFTKPAGYVENADDPDDTDPDIHPACEGDFDGDGDVDGSDLASFAANFGRTDCPTSP